MPLVKIEKKPSTQDPAPISRSVSIYVDPNDSTKTRVIIPGMPVIENDNLISVQVVCFPVGGDGEPTVAVEYTDHNQNATVVSTRVMYFPLSAVSFGGLLTNN